ncbi:MULTISPECIES: N-6 DNA methylase [unclassified Dysgonomonas]|uniref:N-6 DNA methylase n=1 Tax=unclassified Dysgonomonas TaxID=2630389 RepID=UPI002477193E|nr:MULTISPECIES: N-6 DNA methylase [unclassified Dysgonomonas]
MEKDFADFHKAMEKLAYRFGKDVIRAFQEFLEYAIAGHSSTIKVDMSKYKPEEVKLFHDLYYQWIMLQNTMKSKKGFEWFDAFGHYFELHSSDWSKKKKGQFFTPPNLVDMMTNIVNPEGCGKRILDPACGSGRFSIASHAYNPRNFHYAMDIDRTCCMMAALNMMIHGARGEVVWKDALSFTDYRSGWSINPNIVELKGIPHIELLDKENSFIYHEGLNRKAEWEREEQEATQKLLNEEFLDIDEEQKINLESKNEKASFDFF